MRPQEDDSAALAAALRSASDLSRPRDDCPDADRIWRAVSQELPLNERLTVIDHTVECPTCAEVWRLAREMGQRDVAPAARRSTLISMVRQPHVLRLAAAAGVLLAIGVLFAVRTFRTSTDPEVRDSGNTVLRSELADGAALPKEDFRLRWSAGPAAARYDLTVTTRDLDVLVDVRGLDRPEYRVNPERLAQFASGTRLLWRVAAHAPNGLTASSPTFEVSIR